MQGLLYYRLILLTRDPVDDPENKQGAQHAANDAFHRQCIIVQCKTCQKVYRSNNNNVNHEELKFLVHCADIYDIKILKNYIFPARSLYSIFIKPSARPILGTYISVAPAQRIIDTYTCKAGTITSARSSRR